MRRQRVTQAARKLFIENGFHATGMAQVAKTSGVAIGQIYRDFASKEEIVAELVEADCGRLMMYEVLEAAIRENDTDAVRAWLREFVEPSDNPDDARLFAEILAESARSARIAAIFRQIQDELRLHMDEALRLIAPGDALTAQRATLADVIGTLSIGMTHQQLMRPDVDLAAVVRGVQATLDRELNALVAASVAAKTPA
ncbi:Transcriptional regulator, TetR family [Sphingomonas antarctica]|uniref:TetR/AcrR family transcriptional regulator n=1 Tax=Sphingomonas antarctica TaxID=2040274 RepID=UPI0039E86A83